VGHEHLVEGFNLRLDGIHAAVVAAKWPHLDTWNATRRQVASTYDAAFADVSAVETPHVAPGIVPAWRNYPILVDDRDRVRAALHRANVDATVLYGPPVHLQTVYAHLGLGEGSFPVAEAIFERLLCLPVHPGMDEETARYVVDVVVDAVQA
jgi:dTDP-4-amino-4,6-dideoxygalactose transaminase